MLYIDFDGVILDTEPVLFDDWRKNPDKYKKLGWDKITYVKNMDWNYILNNSKIIDNSIKCLKKMDPEKTFILTKIHSLENEGVEKVKWLRKKGVKQTVILVPYTMKKSDMVDVKGNTLIDDCLKNLEDWEKLGGQPIFFDLDDDNYDSWDEFNEKNYKKILGLSEFK